MKLNYFIILLLTLLISEECLSQQSFKQKFDYYEFIANVNGQEVERKIIGTNCKLKFNKKKGIYNLTFNRVAKYKGITHSYVKKGFLNFKIVKNDANGIIVKGTTDISPKPLKIVRDSIQTKQKFELISIDVDDMELILRLFNKKD